MKILSIAEIRAADMATIATKGISSLDLMETAATKCVEWMALNINPSASIIIFAGPGNNGGDGLAIGRLLIEQGYKVSCFLISGEKEYSKDNLQNQKRYPREHSLKLISSESDFPEIGDNEILIDAIFGTGIKQEPSGLFQSLIKFINNTRCYKISIDIPSGLNGDLGHHPVNEAAIIAANHTLTFQVPKPVFMFRESFPFTGDFTILDISLDKNFLNSSSSKLFYLQKEYIQSIVFRRRSKFSYKNNFGHGLLIAGSKGKTGAAVLAATAALRSGSGLITVNIPAGANIILQTALPEAMTIADPQNDIITILPEPSNFSAVAMGPGTGTEKETAGVLKLLIQSGFKKLILDADALNILSENKTWLGFLPTNSILTPHIGEFDRLAGKSENGEERFKRQLELSIKFRIIIVLKGPHTSITLPDGNAFFNSTGNPAMAKGGTGDVLTGVILGLLTRGYPSAYAAIIGVYLHGLAGDIMIGKTKINNNSNHAREDEESLLARDLIYGISQGFKYLKSKDRNFLFE